MQYIIDYFEALFLLTSDMAPYLLLGFLFAGILKVVVPPDLMSKYFEFVWPKYLKSFENMYNFVAFERSQKTIDLAMLIAQLEYGTTKNHEIILRDFGLPHEIVKKISKYFKQCESFEDIQKIKIRKRKKIKKEIYPIEYKILNKYL